jgi:class I lanthipeptide synthase
MDNTTPSKMSRVEYQPVFRSTAQQGFHWQTFIDDSLRKQALEIACTLGERMREPASLPPLLRGIGDQTKPSQLWEPSALAGGFIGIALMYSYFADCFPDQGWETIAQAYFAAAARSTQQFPVEGPQLYRGSSGFAFALQMACQGGTRYQKTLHQTRRSLCEQVLYRQWRRPESAGGVSSRDYDFISGASGILAYLITIEQPDTLVLQAIDTLLAYLTWLAEPGQPLGQERWFLPPELFPPGHPKKSSPQGMFDCGLAHGIPGPLAALALAWLSGYRYPGLQDALQTLSNWLLQHALADQWGRNWPYFLPQDLSQSAERWQTLQGARAGWCYGAPGVARSLWLAGLALDNAKLCQISLETVETMLKRPSPVRNLQSPTLCHGLAGFLQICLHFAHENQASLVREQIPVLTQELLSTYNPDAPFGFRDIEFEDAFDRPGWLVGAAGVVMTLLSVSTDKFPVWDRCLLLS